MAANGSGKPKTPVRKAHGSPRDGGLGRSTTEAYGSVILGFLLAILPMTWLQTAAMTAVVCGLIVDLSLRSRWTRGWPWPAKAVLATFGVGLLASATYGPILSRYQKAHQGDHPTPAAQIVIDCQDGLRDAMIPRTGPYWILSVFPQASDQPIDLEGLMQMIQGDAAPPRSGKIESPEEAKRCEVINYSATTLIRLTLRFRAVFRSAERGDGNSFHRGPVTSDFFYAVRIPRLEPGEPGKFVFLAHNGSDQFADLYFPEKAVAQRVDGDALEEVAARSTRPSPMPFVPTWASIDPKQSGRK